LFIEYYGLYVPAGRRVYGNVQNRGSGIRVGAIFDTSGSGWVVYALLAFLRVVIYEGRLERKRGRARRVRPFVRIRGLPEISGYRNPRESVNL